MATKTIPQLTLRSSITDACMYEIDDGIQSYRVTALQLVGYLQTQTLWVQTAMLAASGITAAKIASDAITTIKIIDGAVTNAKLDDSYISALSAVTPAGADYAPIADTSDSSKKKKCLISNIRNAVWRSVTTTDAVGVDDESMALSGSSFTSTLPALGNSGKRYKFLHTDTSISKKYSIATTGGATIGGVASGSYVICTFGELLELEDPGFGTDWKIVSRVSNTPWINNGAITITGTTTAPTKPSGINFDQLWWRRTGSSIELSVKYSQSNTTSAAAGSGDYLINLPTGILIDSNVITFFTNVAASGTGWSSSSAGSCVGGGGAMLAPSTNSADAHAVAYDTSKFRIIGHQVSPSVNSFWSSAYYNLNAAAQQVSMNGIVYQVSDWQP